MEKHLLKVCIRKQKCFKLYAFDEEPQKIILKVIYVLLTCFDLIQQTISKYPNVKSKLTLLLFADERLEANFQLYDYKIAKMPIAVCNISTVG